MYKITSIEYNAKHKNRYFEQFDIIQTTCIGNFNKMDMKNGVFHRHKIRNNEKGKRFDRNKLKPPENASCFIKANESWHFSFVNLAVKSSDDPVVFNQSSQANCKFKLNFKNLHNNRICSKHIDKEMYTQPNLLLLYIYSCEFVWFT